MLIKKTTSLLSNFYNDYYKKSVVLQRFSVVFSIDVLVRASNLILLPVYLKLMSKDEYGMYTYLYSIISLFSLILNFGFYLSISKLYHDYQGEERKSFLFTVWSLLIGMLSLVTIPIYLFKVDYTLISLMISHDINYGLYREFVFIAIIVSVISFMLSNYFITAEKIRNLQYYNILKVLLVNGLTIFFLITTTNDNVKTRLKFTYVTEVFIILGFSYMIFKVVKPYFQMKYIKKIFKIGFPAMLTSVLGLIFNFSDKFILEKYGTFSDLAVYNLAVTLASIIMMVFASFQSVYLPTFFREKDLAKNYAKTKAIMKKMLFIFIALSIVIYFAVETALFFNLIDKSKYSSIMIVLPILLVTQIIQAEVHLFSNYIIYFEIVYVGTVLVAVLSIINIALNLLLIPSYNYVGSSISALLISIISFLFYYLFIKNKYLKNLDLSKHKY